MKPTARTPWPALPLGAWQDTYATLHMYTQIVGKLRLGLCPPENQFWHVPFYVTVRGLRTSPMPYGEHTLDVEFDFIDHQLLFRSSDGTCRSLPLQPRSVRDFYREVTAILAELGRPVRIWPYPVEVPDPIRFDEDVRHASYDAEAVRRFWEVLRRVDVVFKTFRGRFIGKSSPVHFFWGSFDLAVTRFSGRRAPPRPEADAVTREAYNQEVISLGFWPGGSGVDGPAFYSYTAPLPAGLDQQAVRPASAFYHAQLKEFLLMYDDVRTADCPDERILEFGQSTYEAGARLAGWNRGELEAIQRP
jgi:hypothetical protein